MLFVQIGRENLVALVWTREGASAVGSGGVQQLGPCGGGELVKLNFCPAWNEQRSSLCLQRASFTSGVRGGNSSDRLVTHRVRVHPAVPAVPVRMWDSLPSSQEGNPTTSKIGPKLFPFVASESADLLLQVQGSYRTAVQVLHMAWCARLCFARGFNAAPPRLQRIKWKPQ